MSHLSRHHGALAILISIAAAVSLATSVPAQEPPKKKQCFKLAKIDTPSSHPDTRDGQSWINTSEDVINADGSISSTRRKGKGLRFEGSSWAIRPKEGIAQYTQPEPKGSAEVRFSMLPEILCEGETYTFSFSVATQGAAEAGLYYMGSGEAWKDRTVDGIDPFLERTSKDGKGSFTGRFMPYTTRGFVIPLRLIDGGYGSYVEYHYEPTDEAAPPPKHECPKTFERDWASTNWGKFVIKVSGTSLSGEYSNRDSKFGPGTVSGTVSENKFEGTWKDANGEGTISLTLSADGCSWSGSHTVKPGMSTTAGPAAQPNPGGPAAGVTPGGPTGPAGTGEPGGTLIPGPLGPSLELPADPCMDPAAQQCIEEWIQLATRLRNKYDKSPTGPNGPWRNNEYGIWVGHVVKSGGKHDNWETVYRSNKYCYIWMEYQQEHEFDKYYNDELPMLKLFVEDCLLKKKLAEPKTPGGGTPGTATPGVGTPGTGTPGTGTPGSGSGAPTPPASGKMTLEAMKRTVAAGDTVLVPVQLWNGTDVANMNYTVTYNASIAKAEGEPSSGYLLDDALFTSNSKESGAIKLAFSRSTGITGSGPVANLTFRAAGKPGDKTPLTLAVTTINNPSGATPPIELIHGEIMIVGADGLIPGDCDGDGVVTTADAWCALQMSVGNMPEKTGLDMDKDVKITSRDATLILQARVNR